MIKETGGGIDCDIHLTVPRAKPGWDRLMFSFDRPHRGFDDPLHAIKIGMTDDQRRMPFARNAAALYKLH